MSNETGLTLGPTSFAQKVRSNAKFLRDCYRDLSEAEAEVIAKKLDECADLLEKSTLPEATPISDQGAQAIALLALLGQTAPIQRWKEYEDRGEERIPCFIQVETAKAIAEFFPDSLTPQHGSSHD